MFRYRLLNLDGTTLAEKPTFTSSEPNWRVGDKVLIRPGTEYRIVAMEEPPDDVAGVWIVEPVPNGRKDARADGDGLREEARMTGSGLPVVAVDQGVNLKALRRLQREGRIVLVQAHDLEQSFRHVREQGRPFRLDVSALGGPDMLAGDNVHEVERIVGKEKMADVDHVYASWLNGNDYLITENVDDFIRRGRREQLEAALPGLRIRTTAEFLREFESRG